MLPAKIGSLRVDQGYIRVRVENHPLFPGKTWVRRSRLVMAEKLGRPLEPWEIVHHRDHNKLNDRPSNLELIGWGAHSSMHAAEPSAVAARTGWKHTEEAKARISKAHQGAVFTKEHRANLWKNRQHREGKFGRQTWKGD